MAGWISGHLDRRKDRIEAGRAGRAPVATGFRAPTALHGTGDPQRGRLLTARPEGGHDFEWLGHLAALGDEPSGRRALQWQADWAAAHGDGTGWTPETTGRRLLRWIDHLGFTEPRGPSPETLALLSRHVAFLRRRWQAAPPGAGRIAALSGLIVGTMTLKGLPNRIGAEIAALAAEAAAFARSDGIPSRNPDEALDVLTRLTAAAAELGAVPEPLTAAIARLAAMLRMLTHADGRLARFHGGSGATPDLALAGARVRPPVPDHAMGFHRLRAGRSTVIVDAASPPESVLAHASTLGFELTSGRRPLIVSVGAGRQFPDWAEAARATDSHSTASLEGFSSSRLGRDAVFSERARVFGLLRQTIPEGQHLQASHDGWSASHGLTHTRNLLLPPDGRRLIGEDMLSATTLAERRRFLRRNAPRFAVRFHLHPDVEADHHPGADTITLRLRSGEVWRFTHEGPATLALQGSGYLDPGHAAPRAAQQIVLSGLVAETVTRIGWTLAKAQDTPLAIRDLDRDDDPALSQEDQA